MSGRVVAISKVHVEQEGNPGVKHEESERRATRGHAGLGGGGRLPRLWSSWEPTAERLGEELTLPASRELR